MRSFGRNSSPSRTTKRVLGGPPYSDAGRGRPPRAERYVAEQIHPFAVRAKQSVLSFLEAAVLVDDANAHDIPQPGEKQLWEDERIAMIQHQLVQKAKAKEDEGMSPNNKSMSEAAIRKRQEREQRKAAAAAVAAAQKAKEGTEDEDLSIFTAEAASSGEPAIENASAKADQGPSQPYAITIPTSSNSVSWYRSDAHAFHTLDAARETGIWFYPSNVEERARCGVFRALWEKDYYLGCGIKFGGEYLVYPGALISLLKFWAVFIEAFLQATHCGTTRTSQRPCTHPPKVPCDPWRSSLTVDLALRQRRPTFCVHGTTRPSPLTSSQLNGQDSVDPPK